MNALQNSFICELVQWKKRQAAFLFAVWDVDDEGRVPLRCLRGMLRALFPPPEGSLHPTEVQEEFLRRYEAALSMCRVRRAFHSSSPLKGQHLYHERSSLTLRELEEVIDDLCFSDVKAMTESDPLAFSGASDGNGESGGFSVMECDAFALLLGELERVYADCVSAADSASCSLRISPPELQRLTDRFLDKPLSYHEAAAVNQFFSAPFKEVSSKTILKAQFVAVVLGETSSGSGGR